MSERLTKKQRKSLAHKERGKAKRAAMLNAMDFELNAMPKHDLEEDDDAEKITPMLGREDKRTLHSEDAPRSPSKRKRDENEDIDSSPAQAILPDSNGITANSSKKRKTEQIAPPTPSTTTNDATEPSKAKSKRRYILFVVELNRALRLHNSELDGRTINVEMTVGGGGHGQNRANKLAKKNKSMERQRTASNAKAKAVREARGKQGPLPKPAGTGANALAATRTWGVSQSG
ncbi:hypothetical protein FRC01_002022 [Tulasnella sp. 417]|nr:hypothetical protein FRC01_002022 [Tulasnella sp. 417]